MVQVFDFFSLPYQLSVFFSPESPEGLDKNDDGQFYGFVTGTATLTCQAEAQPPPTFRYTPIPFYTVPLNSTVLLVYCFLLLLFYRSIVLYCSTVLLFCCSTVPLFHCSTVLLFCCSAVLLLYCCTVVLFYTVYYNNKQ